MAGRTRDDAAPAWFWLRLRGRLPLGALRWRLHCWPVMGVFGRALEGAFRRTLWGALRGTIKGALKVALGWALGWAFGGAGMWALVVVTPGRVAAVLGLMPGALTPTWRRRSVVDDARLLVNGDRAIARVGCGAGVVVAAVIRVGG